MTGLIGLVLVAVSASLMVIFMVIKQGNERGVTLRSIPAIRRLQRAIEQAVEDGKRLHISLGIASLAEPTNASALIGLNILERVAQLSIMGDCPPLATSGEGTLTLLSKDILRAAYRSRNALGQYNPDNGRLGGVTPFSYIAATLPIIRDDNVTTHMFIGNFGSEIALLNDAVERENTYLLATSDSLPTQAVIFATATEPLIGEELFAVPTYIHKSRINMASLHTQDFLRWTLIIILIGGSVLKLLGII